MLSKQKPLLFIKLFALLPAYSMAEQNGTIEEIIVSAQMREQNLFRIPLAIDLYDSQLLASTNAHELSDLEFAAPALHFGRGGRKTRGEIGIRGVSDFARNIGGSGRVAVHLDEVPLGRSSAFDHLLSDIKHVEVVKGPQGTLAGINSISGAIHIVTSEPGSKFTAKLRHESGSNKHHLASFQTTIPLTSALSSSLQIQRLSSDGYVKNIATTNDMQGDDASSAKLKFSYSPSPQWKLFSSFDWLEEDRLAINSEALSELISIPNVGTLPNIAPQANEVAHNADEREFRKIWGALVKVHHTMDSGYQLLSISGLRANQFDETNEEDYTQAAIASSHFNEDYRQISQELRILSKKNDRFDYVSGLFLLSSETSSDRSAQLGAAQVTTLGTLDERIAALYSHGNYRFTSSWELSLGARYQNNDIKLDYAIEDGIGMFTTGELQDKKSFNSWLPSLGINFYPSSNSLLYGSISRGTKRGGWNADFVSSLDEIDFNEEYATSYEIGYKDKLFNDRLRVHTALYHSIFSDFQVFQFVLPENGTVPQITITNAGEAISKGLEINIEAQLSHYVTYSLNAAWNNARFDKFEQADASGSDYRDKRLPYAPETKAWTALDFSFPDTFFQGIDFHIDYSYSDGYFTAPNNLDTFKVESFYTVNSRLQVHLNQHWSAAIWGKNLTDEQILRSRDVSFIGIQRGLYEAPRSVGLTIEVKL